ncbi:MAG TPA: hypothetical protein VL563_02755 [Gemmatimonadales bacterium]|jgi:hypothetical protein|nr:hypothetical protein [Gemmatimonadales bacterium]
MRTIAISLVAAGSLGLMALGGRAIASDRMPRARHSAAADSAVDASATLAASRVWYGGTLAPIVVQATAPAAGTVAQQQACPPNAAN